MRQKQSNKREEPAPGFGGKISCCHDHDFIPIFHRSEIGTENILAAAPAAGRAAPYRLRGNQCVQEHFAREFLLARSGSSQTPSTSKPSSFCSCTIRDRQGIIQGFVALALKSVCDFHWRLRRKSPGTSSNTKCGAPPGLPWCCSLNRFTPAT